MSNKYDIPTFPSSGQNTVPSNRTSAAKCCAHSHMSAVDNCAKCGRPICAACSKVLRLQGGDYEGEPLCYDCCHALLSANIRTLKKERRKMEFHLLVSIIGMLAGFVCFFVIPYMQALQWGPVSSGELAMFLVMGLVYACIGGCFFTFLKFYLSMVWELLKILFSASFSVFAALKFFAYMIVGFFKCVFYTLKKLFFLGRDLAKCDNYIAGDERALAQMKKYLKKT